MIKKGSVANGEGKGRQGEEHSKHDFDDADEEDYDGSTSDENDNGNKSILSKDEERDKGGGFKRRMSMARLALWFGRVTRSVRHTSGARIPYGHLHLLFHRHPKREEQLALPNSKKTGRQECAGLSPHK